MSVVIERTVNGYIVTTDDGIRSVFEAGGESDWPQTTQNMLWYVNETIGEPGSRHDEWRVRVNLEPGDKWVDTKRSVADEPFTDY